ncbi:MAG: chromosome segregation protein SMC [Ilumatobacter sp.]|uniref:chromosome segregation protein SMC n=1 Tax=Ilumatobacter sp. TaxID=1967498 RepID=UPI00391DD9D8
MFLKSLTLKGFKSFAESTKMELEPGVTVVVGPNGSGKSNVVDAMAWVLGAQSPKAVRSQKMDDVIFAGTSSRPALGRAEVSITIDNSDGTLGVEFNEVTITRILFRNGDSDYMINGVSCRLLDVQELLSDAGVGRQQHVIVSQGQIDAVLNARPEERRAIIEEAAGVLKFRKRKEKAERRLDATEANLLRVQDLLREVRRQLRPLERQAKAAERHGSLIEELGALKLFVAGREIVALRTKLESLAVLKIESADAERELKQSLASLDTSVMALEAQLSARGASDIGDRLARVEQLRERARGLGAVLAERRRSLERDRGQLLDAGVVANLEADAARFRDELVAVIDELETFEPAAVALDDEETAFRAERKQVLEAVGSDQSASKAASAAAEVRGELRSVRSAMERFDGELRRATARHESLAERVQLADDEMTRFRAECDEAGEVEGPLYDQVEAAEVALAAAVATLEGARAVRATAADAASTSAARVEALQMALDAARARAGAERLAGVDGVLGTLLDLIEIDDGWQASVEAALGESLTAVVVSDPAAARRALDALRSSDTSGAVIALGARPGGNVTPDIGEAVRPHVRSNDPDVTGLLDGLLGGALRVGSVNEALDIALGHPELVVVTEAGDRFGLSGWRIGAAGGGATAAALDAAEAAAESAAADLAAAAAEVERAEAAAESATATERRLNREMDANDAKLSAASEGLARVQGERREIQAELETLTRAIDEANENITREQQRVSELEALLPALESDEQAEADAARARGQLRAELEARAAALASKRKDLEVRNAGLLERQQILERRIAEAERRLEADAEARAAAQDRRVVIERSIAVIDRLAAIVDRHREHVDAHHGDLAEQRRQQSDEVRGLTSELDAQRRVRSDNERRLDVVREQARRAELDEAEAKLRLEAAVETLRRELDTEPAVAEAAEMPELPDGSTPAGRVRELERELRLLGPINPLALEEFNELQTRHSFLEAQLEDVRSTRRELARVIAAVDGEIQNVFAAAFVDVSANFTELFSLLFPGGTGKLKLTHPDDLLNTGIEVEAKPSGKNVKKLSLLSGGERSLTALAYLFAVFRSRPSPFYVMDEVEAALDDVNLHRFLGLIQEFRKDAQLIVVSHQKRTMEAGDCLLGVSMQPGGSSKVVTERSDSVAART